MDINNLVDYIGFISDKRQAIVKLLQSGYLDGRTSSSEKLLYQGKADVFEQVIRDLVRIHNVQSPSVSLDVDQYLV